MPGNGDAGAPSASATPAVSPSAASTWERSGAACMPPHSCHLAAAFFDRRFEAAAEKRSSNSSHAELKPAFWYSSRVLPLRQPATARSPSWQWENAHIALFLMHCRLKAPAAGSKRAHMREACEGDGTDTVAPAATDIILNADHYTDNGTGDWRDKTAAHNTTLGTKNDLVQGAIPTPLVY